MSRPKNYREQLLALCKRYGGIPQYEATVAPTTENPLWEMKVSYTAGTLVRELARAKGRRKAEANERAAELALIFEVNAIKSFPGRAGVEKGRHAEERVVRILNESSDITPGWLKGATHATRTQDVSGHIDVIVHTSDMGDLNLQVKSTEAAKRHFLKKYVELDIAVVVVKPVDKDDVVYHNTLYTIRTLRQRLKSKSRAKA